MARTPLVIAAVGVTAAAIMAVAALVSGKVDTPEPYVVQRGDTLFVIARDHGVSVDELRTWNDIDGDLIEVGQVLWTWGTASVPRSEGGPKRPVAVGSLTSSSKASGLRRPSPKRCLAGPTEVHDDLGMAASEGLSHAQASNAMNGFVHHVLPCLSDGAQPEATLRLQVNVACGGVVDSVQVIESGDWPASVASCVVETLEYAEFPAHGLPDGDTFEYPLRFTPG